MAPQTSISDLPDEVLGQVLHYLSPEQTTLIRRASRRFARLSEEPLLWRYYCRTEFTYWDARHRIKQKFGGDVSDVEWKKLYIYRKYIDVRTSEILDSMLSEQIGRIDKTKDISEFGYDAKDVLLRNCQAETDTDDVLARRCVLEQQLLFTQWEPEELNGQLDFTAMLSSIISTEQRRSTNGTD